MSNVATWHSNADGNVLGDPNVQASTRAHARLASLPVTDGDVESDARIRRVAGRAGDAVGSAGRVVVDDLKTAWPWRGNAPSILDHLADRPELHRVPGSGRISTAAYWSWMGYHYAVALPVLAVLSTVMWLVQHPGRAVPALIVVLMLAAMWM